jgi:hypothetical protein
MQRIGNPGFNCNIANLLQLEMATGIRFRCISSRRDHWPVRETSTESQRYVASPLRRLTKAGW